MQKNVSPSLIVAALLRPIVRYCLKKGFRYGQLERQLQRILVDEARREIETTNGSVSVSKISVVTGLNRPQISKLLETPETTNTSHDLLSRVVGQWSHDPRFRDSDGLPRPLLFQGLTSDFASLVSCITREVSHYPILFELERVGAVEIVEDKVKLVAAEYTPAGDVEHGLSLLGADVEDLLGTVESNVTDRASHPHLHLRTSFDNIPPEKIEELRLWILRKGVEFHKEMREQISQYDRDVSGSATKAEATADNKERATIMVSSFSHAYEVREPKRIEPRKRGRKRGVR